jgi:hypothetical protein
MAGPQQIHRAVDDDAVEPGAEVRPRLEPANLPEGANETLLDDVLGVPFLARQSEGEGKRLPCMELDERTKGISVALTRTRQDGCSFAGLHLRSLDERRAAAVSACCQEKAYGLGAKGEGLC